MAFHQEDSFGRKFTKRVEFESCGLEPVWREPVILPLLRPYCSPGNGLLPRLGPFDFNKYKRPWDNYYTSTFLPYCDHCRRF